MNLTTVIRSLRDTSKQYGAGAALYDAEYRGVNHLVPLKAFKGMALDLSRELPAAVAALGAADLRGARLDGQGRFCSESDLLASLADPEIEGQFDASFVRRAMRRGDACHGVFDGERLVSFGWYATKPTSCDKDLIVHVDPSWIYLYKAYTLRAYRGQRLNGLGVSLAAEALKERARGLVCYIEANNYASLRSFERLGFVCFGSVYLARMLGRPRIWSTPGCKPYGFFVEWTPDAARATA